MPRPTESQILTNFLLPPAPLPTILSLQQFTNLFPSSQRSDPQIEQLYLELQHRRAVDTDEVKENIRAEVQKGEGQSREVARARWREWTGDVGGQTGEEGWEERGEEAMEVDLYGANPSAPRQREHTLRTILPDMERACRDLESEIALIDREAELELAQVREIVGDLSDLRYGRFNGRNSDFSGEGGGGSGGLGQEVVESLKRLDCVAVEAART